MEKIQVTTCDLDSCICDTRHRWHLVNKENPDWLEYALACEDDKPVNLHALKWFSEGTEIIFVSSRPEGARNATLRWLNKLDINYIGLVLDDNDMSPAEFKVQALKDIGEIYDVVAHIDDNQTVLDAVERAFGIDTYRVVAYD